MGQASEEQAQEELRAVREMLADPNIAPGDFTDEDWRMATERVRAIREKVLSNPDVDALERQKYEEISSQVHTLQIHTTGTQPVLPFCPNQ